MAQNQPKPKSKPSATAKKPHTSAAVSKPRVIGPRSIAPKKSSKAAKSLNTVAKRAGGLTGLMEQQLAKRAGYTEMIGGAKGKGGVRRADREAGGKKKGDWKKAATS